MTQEEFYQKVSDSLANLETNLADLMKNLVPSPVQAEERAFVERAELDVRQARAELESKKLEIEGLQVQKALEELKK